MMIYSVYSKKNAGEKVTIRIFKILACKAPTCDLSLIARVKLFFLFFSFRPR